jgi:superfamily II DNA/RNA helicase
VFDARTAALLRQAPGFEDLDAQDLPRALTRHYASLVTRRLRGEDTAAALDDDPWPLDRIADVYEMIASLDVDSAERRAAAFVAGTAQQIIARRTAEARETIPLPVDRDSVDASITAALLFLSAEQYADAHEAAGPIAIPRDGMIEARELGRHVRDLARGNLPAILDRAGARDGTVSTKPGRRLEASALRLLLARLSQGIERLAAFVLNSGETAEGELESAQGLFREVLELADHESAHVIRLDGADPISASLMTYYAGPAHLAALLLSASEAIAGAALTRLPPPTGADNDFWSRWLTFRAETQPFVWRNHRRAIDKGFYETGTSAVLVLPTGAGKTTVSVLKIAGALARGKKVVFLAPTHALVEQLTEDLQRLFPEDRFSRRISGDLDNLILDDEQLKDIEVMTPERCLAILSFSPEAFANVGLLVFDECHLLHPGRKIGRALDSMLCVLAFQAAAPSADMLMLSAMLQNGKELAAWIEELTGRPCVSVSLLWKPSRQARGVVVYKEAAIQNAEAAALSEQRSVNRRRGTRAKSLRSSAKDKLVARPRILWGLQHNWRTAERAHYFASATDGDVQLAGKLHPNRVRVTPNANHVATVLAEKACRTGLKTIVFVNTKAHAVTVARDIAETLDPVVLNASERALLDAIALELGDERHALVGSGGLGAVPHHGAMLRLERKLAEDLFRRTGGAQAIVATPTLAQGLNLPAELAILAGDQRAAEGGGREELEAHELLNAAARAGRAGHHANGVVILIPEPVITYASPGRLSPDLQDALESVLPEDDRCIRVSDPLELVLDRVMQGDLADRNVRYTINRLAMLAAADGKTTDSTFLVRSFAAFRARRREEEKEYMARVQCLWNAALEAVDRHKDPLVLLLSSQSGLEPDHLDRLRQRLAEATGRLPVSIGGWLDWILDWLKAEGTARDDLLLDVRRAVNRATGRTASSVPDEAAVEALRAPLKAWVEGKPLDQIEEILGGNPSSTTGNAHLLPRAREMAGTIIPRGLSFIAGVVGRMTEEAELPAKQPALSPQLLQNLGACIRRGFDTVPKLEFAYANRELFGRVQTHKAYDDAIRSILEEFGDE